MPERATTDNNGTPLGDRKGNDKAMIQVPEREYMRNEAERLSAFAQLIRGCGISVYEIAKGTRIKYDTLLRALRGKSIRSDLEARVRFYINIKNNGQV